MHAVLPSRRTLTLAWLTLMVLTVGAMGTGKVGMDISLGPVWSTALLLIAGLKSGLILWFYLNLRRSTPGWRKGFAAFLVVLLGFILAVYLLTLVL